MSWAGEFKDSVIEKAKSLSMSEKRKSPKTHNYVTQGWGWALHEITLGNDGLYSLMGHGLNIMKGDYLLLKMESGKIAKFEVMEIKYYRDPVDMWRGKIKGIDYVEEV